MRLFCPLALYALLIVALTTSPAQAQFGALGPVRAMRAPRAKQGWDAANIALSAELDRKDIGALAKRALAERVPQDPDGWLRRLALLVRADYRQDALEMLKSRPSSLTRDVDWGLSDLAGYSIRYHDPQLALRLCTLFPEEMYSPETIDHALATLPAGQIDSWLAKQGMQGYGEWYAARIRYRARQGTEGPLMAAEEKQVRAHPDDLDIVDRYLQAVRICRDARRTRDTGWLSEVCRPRLAVESFILGGNLRDAGADPVALYQRSLNTRFTPRDDFWYRDYARRMGSAYGGLGPQLTERQLRDWTKTALMNVYQARGEHAKAQALLEELTAQNKNGLPEPYQAFGAGQVQASSGARVVEKRIIAAETQAENQNAPEYWLKRGLYYSGRKEDADAVNAFEKALKLAPIPVTGGSVTPRWDIVSAYARHLWLRNIERPTDMLALLNRELDIAPPASYYAEMLFQDLANQRSESLHTIDPADRRLWAFLSAQQDWSHFVILLKSLFMDTPADQQDRVWKQAADLAKGGPTSRAYSLGEMEVLWGDARRAIPVLEEALPRATTEQQSWELNTTLWSARQKEHDWKGMEAILVKSPLAGSLLDVANAAADSGANAEAMRLFRKWFNKDRRRFAEFPAHPAAGIATALRTFYHQLSIEEPRCATPAMAAELFANSGR